MTLIAHLPLQEDSGSTARDHSGNGHDASVTGAGPADTGTVSGPVGGTAYDFDGSDDTVRASNDSSFYPGSGGAITWAVWMKNSSTSSQNQLLCMTNANGDGSAPTIQSQYDSNGTLHCFVQDGSGSNTGVDDSTNLNDGAWHFVVFTYDHSTNDFYLYIDGDEVGSSSSSLGTIDPGSDLGIGTKPGNGENFPGALAGVRVYDHALTPGEVRYLYDVATTGEVHTATKTAGSSLSPDLTADVTLNGEAADAYVVGSPGTSSEEVKHVSLSDGENTYSLSWNSGHTDFRVKVVSDLSDPTNRVEVNKVAV